MNVIKQSLRWTNVEKKNRVICSRTSISRRAKRKMLENMSGMFSVRSSINSWRRSNLVLSATRWAEETRSIVAFCRGQPLVLCSLGHSRYGREYREGNDLWNILQTIETCKSFARWASCPPTGYFIFAWGFFSAGHRVAFFVQAPYFAFYELGKIWQHCQIFIIASPEF